MLDFLRNRKRIRARNKYLNSLSLDQRIIEFNDYELGEFCLNNSNDYDLKLVSALGVLKQQYVNIKIVNDDNDKRIEIIEAAFKLFCEFILNKELRYMNSYPQGADIRQLKPHPLTRMKNNAHILDIYRITKMIIKSNQSTSVIQPYLNTLKFRLGFSYYIRNPTDRVIKSIFIENGIKVQEQENGIIDLDPKLYKAVHSLIEHLRIGKS